MPDSAWLNRRYYGGDLPADAERALHAAGLSWDDEAAAEGHILDALALAPGHLEVHIGAYKFYFYRHRLAEALPHAQTCLADALRRSQLPADWRDLRADDPAFSVLEPAPRLVLFSLIAYGYVLARLGREAESRAALVKVAELDPEDRMSARRLLAILDGGGEAENED